MKEETCRCPSCGWISTVKVGEDTPYVSLSAGGDVEYFVCNNPKCNVERIYSPDCVMVSGK